MLHIFLNVGPIHFSLSLGSEEEELSEGEDEDVSICPPLMTFMPHLTYEYDED